MLLYMNTSSMATAGTSETRTRRSALAMEASRPIRSKEITEEERELMTIWRDWGAKQKEEQVGEQEG